MARWRWCGIDSMTAFATRINTQLLVDANLFAPVPVDVARILGARRVIAVVLIDAGENAAEEAMPKFRALFRG